MDPSAGTTPTPVINRLSPEVLHEMTRRLVAALCPTQIILFGSHAWGSPDEDSDVDLFVIVPESDQPPHERAIRARHALRGLNVPKDVIVRTVAEVDRARRVRASLESEILERGIVVHDG
jgi:predicted nucleotidyltransferase